MPWQKIATNKKIEDVKPFEVQHPLIYLNNYLLIV